MAMASRALMVALGLACACSVQAQVILPPIVSSDNSGIVNLAVVGDWGRMGAVKSVGEYDTWTSPPGGTPTGPGYCLARFDTMEENILGAKYQPEIADLMETVCNQAGCSMVLGTGDNFYECGLDTPARWETDWSDIYQKDNMTCLKNLPWFNTFGNHDIVATGSVDAQIKYGFTNPKWVMPSRYYGYTLYVPAFGGKYLSVGVAVINTNTFVTGYHGLTNTYNTVEMQATGTPEQNSAQLDWLESFLDNSEHNMQIVMGHHPVVGGARNVNGFRSVNATNGAGTNVDDGWPDMNGDGSWARLFQMLRKHKVSLYTNGHDHVGTVAVDPEAPDMYKTVYLTSGAGSFVENAGGCGQARPYVVYSSVEDTTGGCNISCAGNTGTCDGVQAFPGFAKIKINGRKKWASVAYYSLNGSRKEEWPDFWRELTMKQTKLVNADVVARVVSSTVKPCGEMMA